MMPFPHSPLRATTILVTGATGFLGSHLTAALGGRGARVIAVSRRDVAPSATGLTWVRADLTDPSQALALLRSHRPQCVIHLSSLANGGRDRSLVGPTFAAEAVATVNLLTASAETGLRRVVLCGSLEEPPQGTPPASPYAAAKATSQLYARLFYHLYALPVVTARVFMTYGPGQPAVKLVPYVVRHFLAGTSPRVISPDRPVDWIYVDDVIAGLVRLAEADGLEGQTIDLGSGTLTPVRSLVDRLRVLTGASVCPEYGPPGRDPPGPTSHARLDATRRAIKWSPQVSLNDGLARTVAALRSTVPGS
jgi:nucleoside-diphosphate-sugar epimerase